MSAPHPRILCVADHFLPGYRGGGPIRTLANMRAALDGAATLAVFTRDRDLGTPAPYPDIAPDRWTMQKEGPVFYASPARFNTRGLDAALRPDTAGGGAFDLLYLNSFFSYRASISLYRYARRHHPGLPVLIAPRGEFSPGALRLKARKKNAFLALARTLGLYRHVAWHASTTAEADDIRRAFPDAAGRIHIAENPVAALSAGDISPPKAGDALRAVFVSRISPKKNIAGLLDILAEVPEQVALSIYGPIEDARYWAGCKARIARLPANVTVAYRGALPPDAVPQAFAAHDIFLFPTLGENFGHVIFESLRAGTPVLTSNRTPWETDPSGAIAAIPLDSDAVWRKEIARAARRSAAARQALRAAARAMARRYAEQSPARAATLAMFRAVAAQSKERL